LGMGHGAWGMGQGKNAIRYRTRIKNRASLILNAHCPMPNAQFPNYRLLTNILSFSIKMNS
jgi:hypothetical protein